jgi:hypothetical protein
MAPGPYTSSSNGSTVRPHRVLRDFQIPLDSLATMEFHDFQGFFIYHGFA